MNALNESLNKKRSPQLELVGAFEEMRGVHGEEHIRQ